MPTKFDTHRCNMAVGVKAADLDTWDAFVVYEGDPLFAELACGKPARHSVKDARTGEVLYWMCSEHKEVFAKMANESTDLDATIKKYELERDSYGGDAEAVAFYNKIIAGLKESGHVCTFPADAGFRCPTCGAEL